MTEYNGLIDFLNLKISFRESNSFLFGKSYQIDEYLITNPFESSELFKNKLEEEIQNFINNNLKKLPFDTDNLCNKMCFDYSSNELIINTIKLIDSINITSMKLINDSNFKIQLKFDIFYINNDNNKMQLLPQLPYTNYDISI
jgi:hypothetical protein